MNKLLFFKNVYLVSCSIFRRQSFQHKYKVVTQKVLLKYY